MKEHRSLIYLSALAARGEIPQGVIDEGRIFSLGQFENSDEQSQRVSTVVDGLREHVGQPFDKHPWAFVLSGSSFERTGIRSPAIFIELVTPQEDGSVVVDTRCGMKDRILSRDRFVFRHSPDGTTVNLRNDQRPPELADMPRCSQYPLAIAILNTRGCSVSLKRAPSLSNKRLVRKGMYPTPARYDVDAAEYLTALSAKRKNNYCGGTHTSPIPHLRRAHERILANGQRIWVSSALVNVRNQDDVSFVEKRKAYRRTE